MSDFSEHHKRDVSDPEERARRLAQCYRLILSDDWIRKRGHKDEDHHDQNENALPTDGAAGKAQNEANLTDKSEGSTHYD